MDRFYIWTLYCNFLWIITQFLFSFLGIYIDGRLIDMFSSFASALIIGFYGGTVFGRGMWN